MEGGKEAAISVTVSSSTPTTLLNVLGIKRIDVSVEAKATSGRHEAFDVAFVLDTTGSMEGARLTSLKSATTALIDDFIARRQDPDQIRVSVVPFGQYVNVGLGNRYQPWISVPNDYQTPTTQACHTVQEVVGQNCTQVWQPAQPARPRTVTMTAGPTSAAVLLSQGIGRTSARPFTDPTRSSSARRAAATGFAGRAASVRVPRPTIPATQTTRSVSRV